MNQAYLILLAGYVLYAVAANRLDKNDASRILQATGVILHGPLLVYAVYYALSAGAFSRQLVSPVYIAAGLLAGHLIFGISLLITHRSFAAAAEQFLDLGPLWDFLVDRPAVLLRFLAVATAEELIYRVTAQPLLIDWCNRPMLSIVLIAAGFSVVHRHFFRNPLGQSSEFVGFALLLGLLYYATGSLILVLVIHAVRNIEIAYLEQLLESQEKHEETPREPAAPSQAARDRAITGDA